MRRFALIALLILILAVVAGIVLLGTMSLPIPSSPVEKTIPNERFQR